MGKDAIVGLRTVKVRAEADLEVPLERRIQKCTEEINRVLQKYGLTLEILNDVNLVPAGE